MSSLYTHAVLRGIKIDLVHVGLKIPAAWITAGVWTDNGELLLVDSSRGELLRLTTDGRLAPMGLGVPTLKVGDIRLTETGMLLKLQDGRFVALDRQGRTQKVFELLTSDERRSGVRGIFNWVPIGETLIAFGDALTSASTWTSGWMQVPLRAPTSFTMITSTSRDSLDRRLYLLGNSYAAAVGSTGYLLVPRNPRPQMFRISRALGGLKQEVMKGFEESFTYEGWPVLYLGGTKKDFVARYGAQEQSTGAVGLYAQGSYLYLLIRQPTLINGQTKWELARLDKDSGRVLRRITLPTMANHLLVIPGKERWAIVEKGRVEAFGQQAVNGVLLISTSWINQAQSGKSSEVAKRAIEERPFFSRWGAYRTARHKSVPERGCLSLVRSP